MDTHEAHDLTLTPLPTDGAAPLADGQPATGLRAIVEYGGELFWDVVGWGFTLATFSLSFVVALALIGGARLRNRLERTRDLVDERGFEVASTPSDVTEK